ncbi:MAG: S46 family peptidase [Ignavibacteriales bacterium]|nr:MAG: S46 family peptidase [Chlorobiota bacterium]MBE7475096.1 S46 family peptidase [Ignavibacteriales bacterium]
MKRKYLFVLFLLASLRVSMLPQSYYYGIDFDTVKAQKFDMGKMWTFENPPLDYFEETYGFRPSEEWLNKVQKSALKFGSGCSASFISEDGLIMTNHHCIRGILRDLSTDNLDLLKYKFYAENQKDELKIPGLFVRQLMMIEDVTEEIKRAMNKVNSDSEKVAIKNQKIEEIKTKYFNLNPELSYEVISLYYGGKYSLYGYKKYTDIRLVFVPELIVSKLGGDYDNFTYPRYGLDCAFLRAYENNKPIKTEYYFNFNTEPVYEDQSVFVVGNPGSTNRLYTIAQLEFLRDYRFGLQTPMWKELYKIYYDLVMQSNAEDMKLVATLFNVGNGLKVYESTYLALQDPFFMARKKDFENKFKNAVHSDPELNKKYGRIWEQIAENRKAASKIANEKFALSISSTYSPKYFFIAKDLLKLAEQLKLPDEKREEAYKSGKIDSLIDFIFPSSFDKKVEDKKLLVNLSVVKNNLPPESEVAQILLLSNDVKTSAEMILAKSKITTKESVIALAKSSPESILNSNDPFIRFIAATRDRINELQAIDKKLDDSDVINNQLLGEALYEVYGDTIPPDATGTLRISDGIIKGYEYNGTIAPIKTTFYGSLDKYYSFNKKFPFNLPDYWENLPEEFDLSTTLDFISTCDIIGGNSGSPAINIDAEVVGLAFDGNMESHSGRFIYTTEANRTVSVSAEGMIEAIRDLYNADKLAEEILNGKIE